MTNIFQQPKPINVVGYRGNPCQFTLRFRSPPPAVTATVRKAGAAVSSLAPTLTVAGLSVTVAFTGEQMTALVHNPHQIELAWNGMVRLSGLINAYTEGRSTAPIIEADLTDPAVTLRVDYNVAQAAAFADQAAAARDQAQQIATLLQQNAQQVDWAQAPDVAAAKAMAVQRTTFVIVANDADGAETDAVIIRTIDGKARKILTTLV